MFGALDLAGAPFRSARSGVQGYLGGLYRGTDGVLGPVRRWAQAVPHAGSEAASIARLHAQVGALQRSAAATAQDRTTAAAVHKLQLQAQRGGYRILPARVVAVGASGQYDWTVDLDAGTDDGVKLDQTVLAGPALVGRVIRAAGTTSTVLLAADPGAGVGVRDRSSGQVGVVTGHGTQAATYAALDPNAAPAVGDELVTGPQQGSTYVAGLSVGRVVSVSRQADGTRLARVRPAVAPTTLDLVGVVLVGGRAAPRPALTPAPSAKADK